MGDGPFTLTNTANDFATIAADAGGTINYTNSDALTVGTVDVLGMSESGITTSNDDVKLTVGDSPGENLSITQPINVVAASLLLGVAGNVAQGPAQTITAAGLGLRTVVVPSAGIGTPSRATWSRRWSPSGPIGSCSPVSCAC